MLRLMNLETAKQAAGQKAAALIQNNTIVGLGTGTTALYFIEALILRCKEGLRIQAVASSRASAELAKQGKIPILDINDAAHIDITVDGADEIDAQKRMIKGGGGAHVREKILASNSKEMIVIVDESKVVPSIGKAKLPVEILPYGCKITAAKIKKLGFSGAWRTTRDNQLFLTENGNYLFDIHFPSPPASPEKINEQILQIPGVIDTGFFFHLAGRVIVGFANGATKII